MPVHTRPMAASSVSVMFGQILTGLAQAFVLSAPTRYSDLWFTNRGGVLSLLLRLPAWPTPSGAALGQLIVPFWVGQASDVPNAVLYVSIIVSCPRSYLMRYSSF